MIGVYEIRNTATQRVYIGSSINILGRWSFHRSELNRGIHGNTDLQRDWIAHGADAFTFSILEKTDRSILSSAEARCLSQVAEQQLYNIRFNTLWNRDRGIARSLPDTRKERRGNSSSGTNVVTLERARKAKGLSQADLAARLDVSPSTVYNWEAGKAEPRFTQAKRVAKVVGVRLDTLEFATPIEKRRTPERGEQ